MDWNFSNDLPIYTQLVSKIKFAIASGAMKPGQKLDSVRDLSAEAGVNPNTMQRAMQDLEREGLVFTQRSSGRFVTEDMDLIDRAKHTLAQGNIDRFLDSMKRLGFRMEEIIAMLQKDKREEDK